MEFVCGSHSTTQRQYNDNIFTETTFHVRGLRWWVAVAGSNTSSGLSLAACRSVLEQDTEPQVAPDVQFSPCMAASAISEGPCDELVTCPGSTLPSPRDSWDWLQQTPTAP